MAYLRYIVLCWLFAEVLAVANAGGDCTRWLKFSPHRLSVERSYLSQGPLQFWATLKPHRPRPKKLTLYTLNTYGLTTAQLSTHFNGHYNYWQTTIAEGKSPQDLQRIARSIEEVKADIVFLQEVKSVHVLENFNRHYLNGRYQTMMFEQEVHPNLRTDLHVHTGLLVKKGLNLDFELHSSRDLQGMYLDKQISVFTHDFLILVVRPAGLNLKVPPLMIIGCLHLKARKSLVHDPQGLSMRQLQVQAVRRIMHQVQRTFSANVPFFLMGDFNGDLTSAPELEAIFQEGLYDTLNDLPDFHDSRVTHTFHGVKNGPIELVRGQLDAILANNIVQQRQLVTQGGIYRWKDRQGRIRPLPATLEERTQNPSDHFPVWATLKLLP